jgi:hypothetical protein
VGEAVRNIKSEMDGVKTAGNMKADFVMFPGQCYRFSASSKLGAWF